ncbi:quinol monooxygenase YgiN [Rhizobium sp. SJZ105]|uniref:antibiotic biosynthesis monooxygenase family protein n=1 Tax=Rhizobium sp. SJZ105 TaxID=2572678 RepID=UPI0011A1A14F|nr:antibiotic biosynthesis monooxygenase [Rhizobium sp. SJZ105]TWC77294.1 quinol monooxygenase YgiN [Rhizobium sp. SJZ105]
MSKPYFVEVAEIIVTDTVGFEAAVAKAKPHFLSTEGCLGLALHRLVEKPNVYRLIVKWRTVEDHTVTFRQSEGFLRWRELASPFFSKPPVVTHSADVDLG